MLIAAIACWARGPFWLQGNFDPAYCYLFNALHVLLGVPPVHIDHPGTPLQELGAGVIWLVSHARHKPAVDDALAHPLLYLNWINAAGLAIFAIVLELTGRSIRRLTGRIDCLIAFQSAALLALPSVVALNGVAPEVLLLSIGCVAGWMLATAATRPAWTRTWLWMIAAGVLCGLAIAIKFTAAPLVVLFFLLLPPGHRRGWFVVLTVGVFFALVWPIRSEWPRMFDWVSALAVHNGRYGGGAATVIDQATFAHHLRYTARQSHVWSGLAALSLIAAAVLGLVGLRHKTVRRPAMVLVSVGLTELLQYLMVAKSPNARYLLPALMLMGGQLVAMIVYAEAAVPVRWRSSFDRAVPVGLVVLLLFGGTSIVRWTIRTTRERNHQLAFAQHVVQTYAGDTRVFYYRSSSPLFALAFGLDFSHDPTLAATFLKQHPEAYIYSIFGGVFTHGNDVVPAKDVFDLHKPVVLIGTADPGKLFPPAGTVAHELERESGKSALAVTRIEPKP